MSSERLEKGYKKLFNLLRQTSNETWFDMGLFLDKIRDNRKAMDVSSSFDRFKKSLSKGIGFVTFDFGIDGVSIEIAKYAEAFEKIYSSRKSVPIHLIGGHFAKETDSIFKDEWHKKVVLGAMGFGVWNGYEYFFHYELERGGSRYNKLARRIWGQTQALTLELAKYVVDNDVRLLVPVNVVSNPGNIPLAFALVLVSEYMDVPIIASNHDFYWEDGKRKLDRKEGEKLGLRDHFFTNSSVGEVFSLLEQLMPWEGKRWLQTTINSYQSENLVASFGHNPVAIRRMPTAVDLAKYCKRDQNKKADILERLEIVLADGKERVETRDVFSLPADPSHLGTEGQPVVIGAREGIRVRLKRGNLLFLQPTRIIKRKRIELDFEMMEELFRHERFFHYFESHEQLTITLLITGPIANGNNSYFNQIIDSYKSFIQRIPTQFQNRIFVAFPFGLENKCSLKERKLADLKIEEIYCVASLTILLSVTEGRGLPILESCASGVPIVCSRYSPEYVYSEVIGERLAEEYRFKVFEYTNKGFTNDLLARLTEVIVNPQSLQELIAHNREVVRKRYSAQHLIKSWESCLYDIWAINRQEKKILDNVKDSFKEHKKITKYDANFKKLVLSNNRRYIPGLTFIEFMVYLKSLIDPSFFRREERELKSRIFLFGESLIQHYFTEKKVDKDLKRFFFKHIDTIFEYYKGNDSLAIDHSLSYRHRHRRHYPFRKLTEQEVCGIVGIIFRKVFGNDIQPVIETFKIGIFRDFKSAILELMGTTSKRLLIDFSDRLERDLARDIEFAFFPGHYYKTEMEIFVLDVIKKRLNIDLDDDLTQADLDKGEVKPISVFVREQPLNDVSYARMIRWFSKKAPKELQLLYKNELVRIIPAKNLASGIHMAQLGTIAVKELIAIKERGGFVVASGINSQMIDMIDMHSYRFGKIGSDLSANYFSLPKGSSFIQWVPAGLKPSLAYPTPIQTPVDFANALKSELFMERVRELGEDEVLKRLRADADSYGNPIMKVLEKMGESKDANDDGITSTTINGIYEDMLPWSGAMVRVKGAGSDWKFNTVSSGSKPQTVLELIDKFGGEVAFAWNGGYILNNELVGKLGLSQEYIGSPLGYLCIGGKIEALPLYNKAALLITDDGKAEFKRINLKKGLAIITSNEERIDLGPECRNKKGSDGPIFYDLLFEDKVISGEGRAIYRFVGNKMIEVIKDHQGDVNLLPVGLTLSLPIEKALKIEPGSRVDFELPEFSNIVDAIEAGPMLVSKCSECIDMEIEGWKTENSIATQAARLDYTDMRGPKMGVGMTADNELILIAINGRIRESVGATHIDLANILVEQGAVSGMGFDPGGSVTLVHEGKQLNISPYNGNYEQNIYTLPPEPRFVGNAILGTAQH